MATSSVVLDDNAQHFAATDLNGEAGELFMSQAPFFKQGGKLIAIAIMGKYFQIGFTT